MKTNHSIKLLTFGFVYCLLSNIYAQTAIYRPIPEADSTSLVVDKLFDLAWANYPQNRVKEHQAQKAYYNMKSSQFAWTESVIAQFNLNEANINPQATGAVNVFYPRYLVGLRLNLGTFVTNPIEAKRAREEYQASLSETDLQKVLLRNEIAKKLEAFKLAKKILKIKTQALEESSTLQQVIKQKFQKSEISFEEYNNSRLSHLQQTENKLTAESEFNVTKIDLETLIGVKIETIRFPSNF
jgi:outer membrane protein TolC